MPLLPAFPVRRLGTGPSKAFLAIPLRRATPSAGPQKRFQAPKRKNRCAQASCPFGATSQGGAVGGASRPQEMTRAASAFSPLRKVWVLYAAGISPALFPAGQSATAGAPPRESLFAPPGRTVMALFFHAISIRSEKRLSFCILFPSISKKIGCLHAPYKSLDPLG